MQVRDAAQFIESVYTALENGRFSQVRTEQGPHINAGFKLDVGCDTISFNLGRDGKLRIGSWSTYGNYSAVYGVGCDASGFVVTDLGILGIAEDLGLDIPECPSCDVVTPDGKCVLCKQ